MKKYSMPWHLDVLLLPLFSGATLAYSSRFFRCMRTKSRFLFWQWKQAHDSQSNIHQRSGVELILGFLEIGTLHGTPIWCSHVLLGPFFWDRPLMARVFQLTVWFSPGSSPMHPAQGKSRKNVRTQFLLRQVVGSNVNSLGNQRNHGTSSRQITNRSTWASFGALWSNWTVIMTEPTHATLSLLGFGPSFKTSHAHHGIHHHPLDTCPVGVFSRPQFCLGEGTHHWRLLKHRGNSWKLQSGEYQTMPI